jgi:energy-coupling factor transporter ATP-binding protein EcfA2
MQERKIIIGIITSTEYIQQISAIWNTQLLESSSARKLAGWVMEYYAKFQVAPKRDIEGIFYQKVKDNNIPKDEAEDIEEILQSLSDESEEEINIEYLVELTNKYFQERRLIQYKDSIEHLCKTGKFEEAERVASEYKVNYSDPKTDLNKFILSVLEIRKHKREPVKTLLSPWLKEGQTTIVYGQYGSGKSLLVISIAYILGLKNYDIDEAEIGTWQVKHPTGCLYIDGELGEQEMEERISQFEWLGVQQSKYRMRILSIPEYQIATEDQFYLSNRINQLKITQWLKTHPNYKLIILDSASTLFGLIEENDNSEWSNKINPFLRDLRALDVACILLHHSGKDGKRGLRGASAMGAMAHNIFALTNHGLKNVDDGEAWFTIGKDKQRQAGFTFKTFSLRFSQENHDKETHWEVTENYKQN